MPTLAGSVNRILFGKDGFYIFNLATPDHKSVTIKGHLPGMHKLTTGVSIEVTGDWVVDPKFGRQVKMTDWKPHYMGVLTFASLIDCCVKSVDIFSLEELVDRTGSSIVPAMETNQCPEFWDPMEFNDLSNEWNQAMACRELGAFFTDAGLTSTDLQATVELFGYEAAKLVRDNPYVLMQIPKFNFPKVDKLAALHGIESEDTRRVTGAVLWAINSLTDEGHLFVYRDQVESQLKEVLHTFHLRPLPLSAVSDTLDLMVTNRLLVQQKTRFYLPHHFKFEQTTAKLLAARIKPSEIQIDLAAFVQDYEVSNGITLSEAQVDAIGLLLKSRVLAVTGLPGTGKTTVVKALVKVFENAKIPYQLMAPTGIAAQRMSAVTGRAATTIHRALKYDGLSWGHDSALPLHTRGVIVDETSMVDQELLYRLVSALTPDTIIVFVGDAAQLPSVGPGNVLRELTQSELVPSVSLSQIFRQAEQSHIVVNSHRIHKGEAPIEATPAGSDFRFVSTRNEKDILSFIVDAAVKLKGRDANFQVLCPKYAGEVGVDNLNTKLRDALNPPGPPEWKGGSLSLRLGDRVMVIKNNYSLGVYNGDMGKVVDIADKSVSVKVFRGGGGPDPVVKVTSAMASSTLKLAYAVTVHRMQGQEFDVILFPMVQEYGRMLQRNLLYTGVTRAKKKVFLVGDPAAVARAVGNNKVQVRNTAFGEAIANALVGTRQPLAGKSRAEAGLFLNELALTWEGIPQEYQALYLDEVRDLVVATAEEGNESVTRAIQEFLRKSGVALLTPEEEKATDSEEDEPKEEEAPNPPADKEYDELLNE